MAEIEAALRPQSLVRFFHELMSPISTKPSEQFRRITAEMTHSYAGDTSLSKRCGVGPGADAARIIRLTTSSQMLR